LSFASASVVQEILALTDIDVLLLIT
jgi:hypothetical protein